MKTAGFWNRTGLLCSCGKGVFRLCTPADGPPNDSPASIVCENCNLFTTLGAQFAGLCGCDGSEDTELWLAKLLQAVEQRRALEYLQGSDAPKWFILHQLDHLGLLEHGSNVGFGWLTNLGVAVLQMYMQAYKEEF